MAKTTVEKIEGINQEIEQLKNRQKQLQQKHKSEERKARTKRLCSRAGLLESMLPDTITLTDEQFKLFLEKTAANDFGRRTLVNIAEKSVATAPPQTAETATQDRLVPVAKPAKNAQESCAPKSADESCGTAPTS